MELVQVFTALFASCILLHDWHSERVSMGLTVSRKTAKNLVVRRKN